MTEQKDIRVIFKDGYDPVNILDGVLEKNGLKNNGGDERQTRIIINDLMRDFVLKNISPNKLVSSLQDQLKISQEAATLLSQDIKAMIIPFTEIFEYVEKEGEATQTEKDDLEKFKILTKVRPITSTPTPTIQEQEIKKETPAPRPQDIEREAPEKIDKIEEIEKIMEKKRSPQPQVEEMKSEVLEEEEKPVVQKRTGPDSYREPIE